MTRGEQLADLGAGVSVLGWLGISFSTWNDLIHIVAGVIAALAGLAALTYHIIRIVQSLKKRG